MSDYQTKPGNGAIFKNNKKEKETHPDYNGKIVDPNGKEWDLSLWVKKSAAGNSYFSVAVKDELDKVYFMQSSSISQRITNIGVAFRFNPQNVPNDIPLFLEVTAQIDDKPQKTVKTLPIRLV